MEWLADLAVMGLISGGFIYVMVLSAAEAVCAETEAKRDASRLDA